MQERVKYEEAAAAREAAARLQATNADLRRRVDDSADEVCIAACSDIFTFDATHTSRFLFERSLPRALPDHARELL